MDHPPEEVPGYLVRGESALAAERTGDPVLVLEAEDPAVHDVSVGAASLVPTQHGAREGRPADSGGQDAGDVLVGQPTELPPPAGSVEDRSLHVDGLYGPLLHLGERPHGDLNRLF